MKIGSAAVIGLGTMGAGIVEVLLRAGVPVHAVEVDDGLLAAGRTRLAKSLDRAVERGTLSSEDRAGIEARTTWTTERRDLGDVDLIIEAVPERLDIKTALFAELNDSCKPETIFATNTSSLAVTAIAAACGRPDRVIGMHFFNPAPVMRLVEVISTGLTAEEVTAAVVELAGRCGKTPVAVGDRAGFVANTLLLGYLGHAARLIDTGVVSVADLDAAMTASCGLPMGPARLMDLIGLDVCVEVIRVLDAEFGLPRYALPPALLRLTMAGRLGRKTAAGWWAYSGRDAAPASVTGPVLLLAATSDAPSIAIVAGDGDADRVRDALGAPARVEADDADVVLVALGDDPSPLRAETAARPGQTVLGVHLPRAPRPTPVVELVVTDAVPVEPAVVASVRAVAAAAGRTVVVCRARPGYVVEALLFAQLDDAARMVGDGYATPADVDAAMTLGCGYPAGPFALIDEIGAGKVVAGLTAWGQVPAPLLADLAAGLGRHL